MSSETWALCSWYTQTGVRHTVTRIQHDAGRESRSRIWRQMRKSACKRHGTNRASWGRPEPEQTDEVGKEASGVAGTCEAGEVVLSRSPTFPSSTFVTSTIPEDSAFGWFTRTPEPSGSAVRSAKTSAESPEHVATRPQRTTKTVKCVYAEKILWSLNKLARSITKWTKACDKRLNRLISYIHHTCEYKQYCYVCNTAKNAGWDGFKTPILREMLRTQNLLREEHCAFLEVIHLFQQVGCVRNKLQFRTVQQNPKSSL